jgi:hypothetical protein
MCDEQIVFLDVINCPVFIQNTQRFGDWILSPSSGGTYLLAQSVELIHISGPFSEYYQNRSRHYLLTLVWCNYKLRMRRNVLGG